MLPAPQRRLVSANAGLLHHPSFCRPAPLLAPRWGDSTTTQLWPHVPPAPKSGMLHEKT
ncbi:hypothetical protein K438DRAFT_1798551, partial [Mycena galopus ATCC 62051]